MSARSERCEPASLPVSAALFLFRTYLPSCRFRASRPHFSYLLYVPLFPLRQLSTHDIVVNKLVHIWALTREYKAEAKQRKKERREARRRQLAVAEEAEAEDADDMEDAAAAQPEVDPAMADVDIFGDAGDDYKPRENGTALGVEGENAGV